MRREPALFERHVIAILQNLKDRGIGRGPADAELFHLADKARLGETRGRLGEMLFRRYVAAVHRFAFIHRRQDTVALITFVFTAGGRTFVLAFLI